MYIHVHIHVDVYTLYIMYIMFLTLNDNVRKVGNVSKASSAVLG